MVQYQVESNGLGIDEMMKIIIANTFKAPRLPGLQGLIQQQNEQLLLTYLLSVSINVEASFATQSQILNVIDAIKIFAAAQLQTSLNDTNKGHLRLLLERIKSPEKASPSMHEVAPPGSPIGCDMEY